MMNGIWKIIAATSIAVAATASPVIAQSSSNSVPVYTTIYFSDASHSTQVGIITGECQTRWGQPFVQYSLNGVQSAYSEETLAYYCGNGGPDPI